MKHIIIWLLAITSVHIAYGQTISGYVFGEHEKKRSDLAGATIQELNCPNGVIAGDNGYFEITIQCKDVAPKLVVSYVGFDSDTVDVSQKKAVEVVLKPAGELGIVEINKRRKTYGIRAMDPKTTLLLREQEFQKAACCNLSESFENAPAIDVSFTDAVTGTKQIRMLGLDGFYTSISREFMPAVRGLNTFYGLSFIPAAWVESIQITKGAGSVVNGYESMAGQINIEMKKPFGHSMFMLDQFVSESGRTETDLMFKKDLNKNLATSFFGRFAARPLEMDRNNDKYLDNPTGKQVQLMNRWQFFAPGSFEGQVNVAYNNDEKLAGQSEALGPYQVKISNEQLDVWAKLGKSFKDKPYKSFGSQYAYNSINSSTSLGNFRQLNLKGQSAYVNLMYQSIFGNTNHEFKTGLSVLADWMEESLDRITLNREEQVVGGYFEYTLKPDSSTTVVTGVRGDYSNLFGFFPTARVHIKKAMNEGNTSLRLSGGNGYRTPNFFGQHQNFFISSRGIAMNTKRGSSIGIIQENSWNYGASLEHKFDLSFMPSSLQLDFFRTQFVNELLVSREESDRISFYEVGDGTISNSLQAQFDVQIRRRIDFRMAYRMFDVTSYYPDVDMRLARPFISKHRGFVNLTMANRKKWQWNITGQLYGQQRIPGVETNGATITQSYSKAFPLLSTQLSKRLVNKPFEWYVGLENILNYKQENPILNAENPVGPGFDAAMVWGPVFGRMAYAGFRYRLNINEDDK